MLINLADLFLTRSLLSVFLNDFFEFSSFTETIGSQLGAVLLLYYQGTSRYFVEIMTTGCGTAGIKWVSPGFELDRHAVCNEELSKVCKAEACKILT